MGSPGNLDWRCKPLCPRLSGAQCDSAFLQLLVLISSVSLGETYLVPHSVPDERTQGRPCYGFGDRLGSRPLKAMTLKEPEVFSYPFLSCDVILGLVIQQLGLVYFYFCTTLCQRWDCGLIRRPSQLLFSPANPNVHSSTGWGRQAWVWPS